jgi:hypothetical protein
MALEHRSARQVCQHTLIPCSLAPCCRAHLPTNLCLLLRAPNSLCKQTAGQMWQMWDEKISGDSETRNWLAANTKPCPKCSKPVEKNGGCNLVVCKCGQVRWGG